MCTSNCITKMAWLENWLASFTCQAKSLYSGQEDRLWKMLLYESHMLSYSHHLTKIQEFLTSWIILISSHSQTFRGNCVIQCACTLQWHELTCPMQVMKRLRPSKGQEQKAAKKCLHPHKLWSCRTDVKFY